GAEVIVDALVVEAVGRTSPPLQLQGRGTSEAGGGAPSVSLSAATSPGNPGKEIFGPALIFDPSSTTVVEPGWRAERAEDGTLVLNRAAPIQRAKAIGADVDPVRLEIFNNLFMA